jgi:site-specific recombinase XerD
MLTNTIERFLEERSAARYSPHTLNDYQVTFKKFLSNIGDVPLATITRADIIEFMNSQTDVSSKTLRNYHANLSSLWQWGMRQGYCSENIVRSIQAPIGEKKEVLPFERIEILTLLEVAGKSYGPVMAMRNQAILYLLLDSGIRASELCGLKIKSVNKVTNHITVFGKGKKERKIPVSTLTLEKIEKYLEARPKKSEWVFTTRENLPVSRLRLDDIIEAIGKLAGIHAYPHRFRHTFAIQFLRNGGNIYSLQKILGHTTLDMVKRYLAISQIDIDHDHAAASPVMHWIVES